MEEKTLQKAVRTAPTQSGYWSSPERYGALNKLLGNGWKVVMCNKIGEDLEYIVEKEEEQSGEDAKKNIY